MHLAATNQVFPISFSFPLFNPLVDALVGTCNHYFFPLAASCESLENLVSVVFDTVLMLGDIRIKSVVVLLRIHSPASTPSPWSWPLGWVRFLCALALRPLHFLVIVSVGERVRRCVCKHLFSPRWIMLNFCLYRYHDFVVGHAQIFESLSIFLLNKSLAKR